MIRSGGTTTQGCWARRAGALSGQLRFEGPVECLETSLVEGRKLATYIRVSKVAQL